MGMTKQPIAPISPVPPTAAPPVTVVSRAPEPTVDRIEELAGRILRGDILLPKFQRDFVWEKHQIGARLSPRAARRPHAGRPRWRRKNRPAASGRSAVVSRARRGSAARGVIRRVIGKPVIAPAPVAAEQRGRVMFGSHLESERRARPPQLAASFVCA
jgi:hypothetical protein